MKAHVKNTLGCKESPKVLFVKSVNQTSITGLKANGNGNVQHVIFEQH